VAICLSVQTKSKQPLSPNGRISRLHFGRLADSLP